ncbi:hypothetical protein MRX96_006089 [Rhipicephalus microplus]
MRNTVSGTVALCQAEEAMQAAAAEPYPRKDLASFRVCKHASFRPGPRTFAPQPPFFMARSGLWHFDQTPGKCRFTARSAHRKGSGQREGHVGSSATTPS